VSTFLIVYGTKEGHTAAIAERMRTAIAASGHEVRLERASGSGPEVEQNVDGVLVGASVHAGKHQKEVREFVERNRARLEAVPSAFFQVCLQAADPSPESAAMTQALIDELTGATGWRPARTATFAGMLAWTQYDLFTRLLMRLVVRKQHLSPEELDSSHDVDYTDYEAVDRFAREFARLVGGEEPAVTASAQPAGTSTTE
jgi:menaquinone-dependent protoporphyrinogen oxidase